MGLKNYRLVVGRAMDLAEDDDDSPHLEILLDVDVEGELVHHVRYAKRDLGAEGWTVVF